MTALDLTFGVSAAGNAHHLAEFARAAEALGFDRVTMGEHVMDGNPPRPTDLALPPESLEELKEAMGDRMKLYPSGGHLGNLWDPETKDYLLGLFRAAP